MTAPSPASAPPEPTAQQRLVAWVDGVGAFLLCLDDALTLGGLAGRADVRLAADLAAGHASIRRSGEGYVVEASGPALVANDGRPGVESPTSRSSVRFVDGRTDLANGDEVLLYRDGGSGVRLRFGRPNALTSSATLSVASDHRTEPRYDGVVLMAEACLFGPGRDAHIRCRHWAETVLLFRRDGRLWCKSPQPLSVDGTPAPRPFPVESGIHVTGDGISFRLAAP